MSTLGDVLLNTVMSSKIATTPEILIAAVSSGEPLCTVFTPIRQKAVSFVFFAVFVLPAAHLLFLVSASLA